ncbi:MAG: cupin domain-containing protein [Planctomycetota bacterium]|nr:cupin domain-containing protein [Planctomycetota bacterium]
MDADSHFLKGALPGKYLCGGSLSYKPPGLRTHDHDGPEGKDYHVHDDCEAFVILQGKAVMQIDGTEYPLQTGDVVIVEPGEEHHLIADAVDPCVNLWLHAGAQRPPEQQ